MTRGIDDVEGDAPLWGGGAGVSHRGVFGQDGDALFALQVHGVHDAIIDVLIGAEGSRLPEHGIHERGLAVINVGNDSDVTKVRTGGSHPETLRGRLHKPAHRINV